MSGRQQQDQQPPRRGGRAFPSPQPYQPRRRHEQVQEDAPAQRSAAHAPTAAGLAPGGRGPRQRPMTGPAAKPGPDASSSRHKQRPASAQHPPSSAQPPKLRRHAAEGAAPPAPSAQLAVADLVAAAGDTRSSAVARAAALQQLHQRLFDPSAQREALQQLQAIWPRLLALLWDEATPTITAAAAPVVGAIGALAAQAAAAAAAARATAAGSLPSGLAPAAVASAAAASGSSASGLLFDWLLPVLERRASPAGKPLQPHQLAAALVALRDCLTGKQSVDAVTLARYANAVFAACQALLEDAAMPPAALPPLLAVLQHAARHQHSLRARFQDLVDLLLGWALEPALPDAARPALSRTLAAFGAQWRQQPSFTATLLDSLTADMSRLAGKAAAAEGGDAEGSSNATGPKAAGSAASLRQVLALAACVLPILDAAVAARVPSCRDLLLRMLRAFEQAAAATSLASSTAAAAALAELAAHAARLAVLAPAAAAASLGQPTKSSMSGGASQSAGLTSVLPAETEHVSVKLVAGMQALSLHEAAAAAAQEHVHLQLDIQQPMPAAQDPQSAAATAARAAAGASSASLAPSASLHELFFAVAGFVSAGLRSPHVLAQAQTVLSALAAVRGWLEMLAAQCQQADASATQLDAAAAVLLPLHVASGTASPSSGAGGSRGWLLGLRMYPNKEVVLQAAQVLGWLVQRSSAALGALLDDTAMQAAALAREAGEARQDGTDGSKAGTAACDGLALLLFNLRLLELALPQLPHAGCEQLWRRLLPLTAADWLLHGSCHMAQQAQQALLRLLPAVAQRLADTQPCGELAGESFHVVAALLGGKHSSEAVVLLALQWLHRAATWLPSEAEGAAGALAGPQAAGHGSHSKGRATEGLSAAMDSALGCANAPSAVVRQAALAAACALASSARGAASLLQDPAAGTRLYHAALLCLSDVSPGVSAAAGKLLEAAAAPLALAAAIAANGQPGASNGLQVGAAEAAMEAAAAALGPQQLGFRPAQLQQVLSYLGSPAGPGAVLTASGRQQTALGDWLPRLLHSMQATPAPAESRASSAGMADGSRTASWQVPSCLSLAAWWAVQEAAKQCVASRLRTPMGGPAQTLAALEQALLAAVRHLQDEAAGQATSQPGPPADTQKGFAGGCSGLERRRQAALLLLFLHALEQGIAAAAEGWSSRASASQAAVGFFAANNKVCAAWFVRMRPALLRAAGAAELHELTAYHAFQRLQDLEQQAQALAVHAGSGTGCAAAKASPLMSSSLAASSSASKEAAEMASAGGAAQAPLGDRANSRAGVPSASPAAALLAATQGSPDVALRQQHQGQNEASEPASPGAALQASKLARQRAQQIAAKAAEAAAAAAAALCALRSADGIAGLQAYCRAAFRPLLEQLYAQQADAASGAAAEAAEHDAAAAAAAAAAWDWLAAAEHQAAGQYEAAIEEYSVLYSAPGAAGQQCAPASAVACMVAQAYAALGDSQGLEAWRQTRLGSRLPPGAAARCMRLASWAGADQVHQLPPPLPVQPMVDSSSAVSRLLSGLQLHSLDLSAYAGDSGGALQAAGAALAELVAEGSRANQHPLAQLPTELLFTKVAAAGTAGGHPPQQGPHSAWQLPGEEGNPAPALECLPAAPSLPSLLLLAGKAALLDEQRAVLQLAACHVAAAGGNAICAQRLLAQAEASLEARSSLGGDGGSLPEAAQLLARLHRLKVAAASSTVGSTVRSQQAWQLLLEASATPMADSVVPAAAQLLLFGGQPSAGIALSEAAQLAAAVSLPRAGSSLVALEQHLQLGPLAFQLPSDMVAPAPAVQYGALKAAVAAAPQSGRVWWDWAQWLCRFAEEPQLQHQLHVTRAAHAAAFEASCQALVHGAAGSSGSDGFGAVPALLQVLRLLTQHSDGSAALPADAAAQLAAVPAAAWLAVVPQLVSQLADGTHPTTTSSGRSSGSSSGGSPSRRQSLIHGLLLHVGATAPCQVLLPATVAAEQLGSQLSRGASAEPGSSEQGRPAPLLAQLVQQLRQEHAPLAQQLQVLTAECARLAVLPEEHWQAVLQEAAATAAKRLQALHRAQKQSAAAAGAAVGLDDGRGGEGGDVREHGSGSDIFVAMAPVLLALQQQLSAAEAATPSTPHELRFRQQWLPRLQRLYSQLVECCTDRPDSAAAVDAATASQDAAAARHRPVALLRAAAAELAGALRAKQLALSDTSPALASLAHTGIPIPGAASAGMLHGAEAATTLVGVAAEVAVLSTKTRPKRLRFAGSDGAQHSFLLKGREDLRAEARLMQLLQACRAALQAGTAGGGDDAAIHCFEVTPLGRRVGLVQWVEGSTPLFELYSAWQQGRAQRQRLLAAAAAGQQRATTTQVTVAGSKAGVLVVRKGAAAPPAQLQGQPLRPVDMFFAKLREAGIDPAMPRDAWPAPKLVAALRAMEQTVDRQLLWREVWLGSSGAADWWQRQRRFASSTAVMSMVGHLLGLGDRHLDNMLLHRRSCHLVHIDFSVVFDRGLHLKVPEVVPFRLTQTLVAALGVTGVEGMFRLGCERTLRVLRASSAPLCALLEAVLLDAGVDWEAEAAAKSAAKAFAQALSMRAFDLRQSTSAAQLAAAAGSARASLAATAAALGAYVQQFLAAASTAAAAAESRALLQRCEATLSSAAAQERQLAGQAEEGRVALERVLADAQPLAARLQACLHECQAWQQRHGALLPLLLANPPAALLAGPATSDLAAAAAGGSPPLLLVTAPPGAAIDGGPQGAGSLLHATLGVLPSQAPLSASVVLQAGVVDQQGVRLLQEQAAASRRLAGALRQYAAAAACMLGGVGYAASSQHTHWAAAFRAAMDLPIPQGFERAAELAPRQQDPAEVAPAWRPLAAAAAAAVGLAEQLGSTAAALKLERVDVALGAADTKQHAVDAAAAAWAAAAAAATAHERGHGAAALALAFASFSEEQAANVLQLAADHDDWQVHEQAGAGMAVDADDAEAPPAPALLEGVQRLVLGYASMAVAVRDATSEALFLSPDGSSLLGWLSAAVQAADSLSTASAELQLLLPPLLALLFTPASAAAVAAAVGQAAEQLQEAEQSGTGAEQTAAAAMQPLLAVSGQYPAVAALLQGVQSVQSAAQLLLPPEELPSLAQQQLLLATAVVGAWQELEDAAQTTVSNVEGGSHPEPASAGEGAGVAAAASTPWQQCSAALAAAVAAEVAQHLLLPLADALGGLAMQLRAAAPGLARRAGLEAAAAAEPDAAVPRAGLLHAGSLPELVPFTDFDSETPGAGVALGGLEDDELEGPGGGHQSSADLAGSRRPGKLELVPFLDFDEGLAGADELLESLELGGSDFEAVHGGSQEDPLQPKPLLSQQCDGEVPADGDRRTGTPSTQADARQLARQLAAAADAAGALAAVDAVLYVGALALQQSHQLRQQHCLELATFQWLNEHLLPAEAITAGAALLSNAGVELSPAAAAAAGTPLPAMHPAVVAWTLQSNRGQLLAELVAGVASLQALDGPMQQWRQQLAGTHEQLAAEVAAAVPYAAPTLQQGMLLQQQWLQQASGLAASLAEVSQAVLQFEASRTADADVALSEPQQAQQEGEALAQYQGEQRDGWQRYAGLLQEMRRLQGSYAAAQRGIAAATAEQEQLQQRRREALAIKESAEAAGSNAAANYAALALPLVKSTQQLPSAVTRLLPQLSGVAECVTHLHAAHRTAAELASVEAGEDKAAASIAAEAHEITEQLGVAADCLHRLPAAVEGLQAALLPARNRLLAGRRGEAAAQAQAADVIDALSSTVMALSSQLEQAEQVQRWLDELPAALQLIASRAGQHAAALQREHGFSLGGLERLMAAAGQDLGAAGAARRDATDQDALPLPNSTSAATLSGGLLLSTGTTAAGGQQRGQRHEYAGGVLQRFRSKLVGRPPADSRAAAAVQGEAADQTTPTEVSADVQQLIQAATSRTNLARMYEGWMPWV